MPIAIKITPTMVVGFMAQPSVHVPVGRRSFLNSAAPTVSVSPTGSAERHSIRMIQDERHGGQGSKALVHRAYSRYSGRVLARLFSSRGTPETFIRRKITRRADRIVNTPR